MRIATFIFSLLIVSSCVQAEELPELKVGVLKFGTINWEMSVIKEQQRDINNGFNLTVVPMASKNAAAIALQSKAVDVIMTDAFWVARQRHLGKQFQMMPMHKISGGVFGPANANFDLTQLTENSLGIAGGATDKNYIILQSYLAKHSLSLDRENLKFAAPPLLQRMTSQGQINYSVNFWHYNARLEAQGFINHLPTTKMLKELGIDDTIPLLGWVADSSWLDDNRTIFTAFVQQSWQVKNDFMVNDALWEQIKPLTKAENEQVFQALKANYPSTILKTFTQKEKDAFADLFALALSTEQSALLGDMQTLPENIFWSHAESIWQGL